jgi:mono/diheme cytochrome c family protein
MRYLASFVLVVGVLFGCQKAPETETVSTAPEAPKTAETPKTEGTTASTASGGKAGYAAVQELFNTKCVGCHQGAGAKEGIDLTSYEALMKGGEHGPTVKPGDPEGSLLAQSLRGGHGVKRMPMGQPALAEAQIKLVEDWIKAGAKNDA